MSRVSRVCNENAAASGTESLRFCGRTGPDGVGGERAWAWPSGPPNQGHLLRKRDAILNARAVLDPPGCFYFRTRKAGAVRGAGWSSSVRPHRGQWTRRRFAASLGGRTLPRVVVWPACGCLSGVTRPHAFAHSRGASGGLAGGRTGSLHQKRKGGRGPADGTSRSAEPRSTKTRCPPPPPRPPLPHGAAKPDAGGGRGRAPGGGGGGHPG